MAVRAEFKTVPSKRLKTAVSKVLRNPKTSKSAKIAKGTAMSQKIAHKSTSA